MSDAEIPMITTWMGRDVESLGREELLVAFKTLLGIHQRGLEGWRREAEHQEAVIRRLGGFSFSAPDKRPN